MVFFRGWCTTSCWHTPTPTPTPTPSRSSSQSSRAMATRRRWSSAVAAAAPAAETTRWDGVQPTPVTVPPHRQIEDPAIQIKTCIYSTRAHRFVMPVPSRRTAHCTRRHRHPRRRIGGAPTPPITNSHLQFWIERSAHTCGTNNTLDALILQVVDKMGGNYRQQRVCGVPYAENNTVIYRSKPTYLCDRWWMHSDLTNGQEY